MPLGERLKALRGDRSQKEIAAALELSRSAYSMYELDEREPDYTILTRMAEVFGVTTDYLLGHDRLEPVDPKLFGQRLQAALQIANRTKVDLANAFRIGVSRVDKWIRGQDVPGRSAFAYLAEYLGVHVDYLTGVTNDPQGTAPTPLGQGDEDLVVLLRGKRQRLSKRDMEVIKALLQQEADDNKNGQP